MNLIVLEKLKIMKLNYFKLKTLILSGKLKKFRILQNYLKFKKIKFIKKILY